IGEPYWMPEVELGIGRYQGVIGGISQQFLSWYDKSGNRYLTSDEQAQLERTRAEQERTRAEQERTRAEQERTRVEHLAQYLRSLGIDPDNLPSDS
ncbi:MAG: hypothetical protein PUP92_02990, partial [Rhizonema sp. PD38]|nr:hypothetical protein [Rhizonema sp. PD38]